MASQKSKNTLLRDYELRGNYVFYKEHQYQFKNTLCNQTQKHYKCIYLEQYKCPGTISVDRSRVLRITGHLPGCGRPEAERADALDLESKMRELVRYPCLLPNWQPPQKYAKSTSHAMSQENQAGSSEGSTEIKYIRRFGATVLLRAGHQYTKKREYNNGASKWECYVRRKCKCYGTLTMKDNQVLYETPHECTPDFTKNLVDGCIYDWKQNVVAKVVPPAIPTNYNSTSSKLNNLGPDMMTRMRVDARRAVRERLGIDHLVPAAVLHQYNMLIRSIVEAVAREASWQAARSPAAVLAAAPAWVREVEPRVGSLKDNISYVLFHKKKAQEPRYSVVESYRREKQMTRSLLCNVALALRHGAAPDDAARVAARASSAPPDLLHDYWERLRALCVKKLRVLSCAGDVRGATPYTARLAVADWFALDLALLYYCTDDLIDEESMRQYDELSTLTLLFSLVQHFKLAHNATRDDWVTALHAYISRGRSSSIVVLQRRWYELVRLTRARVAAHSRAKRAALPPLLRQIAVRFPELVATPQPPWEQLVREGKIYTTELAQYEREEERALAGGAGGMLSVGVAGGAGGAPAPWTGADALAITGETNGNGDDDIVLIEEEIDTIDLSDSDDSMRLKIDAPVKTESARSDDVSADVKDDNIDIDEQDIADNEPKGDNVKANNSLLREDVKLKANVADNSKDSIDKGCALDEITKESLRLLQTKPTLFKNNRLIDDILDNLHGAPSEEDDDDKLVINDDDNEGIKDSSATHPMIATSDKVEKDKPAILDASSLLLRLDPIATEAKIIFSDDEDDDWVDQEMKISVDVNKEANDPNNEITDREIASNKEITNPDLLTKENSSLVNKILFESDDFDLDFKSEKDDAIKIETTNKFSQEKNASKGNTELNETQKVSNAQKDMSHAGSNEAMKDEVDASLSPKIPSIDEDQMNDTDSNNESNTKDNEKMDVDRDENDTSLIKNNDIEQKCTGENEPFDEMSQRKGCTEKLNKDEVEKTSDIGEHQLNDEKTLKTYSDHIVDVEDRSKRRDSTAGFKDVDNSYNKDVSSKDIENVNDSITKAINTDQINPVKDDSKSERDSIQAWIDSVSRAAHLNAGNTDEDLKSENRNVPKSISEHVASLRDDNQHLNLDKLLLTPMVLLQKIDQQPFWPKDAIDSTINLSDIEMPAVPKPRFVKTYSKVQKKNIFPKRLNCLVIAPEVAKSEGASYIMKSRDMRGVCKDKVYWGKDLVTNPDFLTSLKDLEWGFVSKYFHLLNLCSPTTVDLVALREEDIPRAPRKRKLSDGDERVGGASERDGGVGVSERELEDVRPRKKVSLADIEEVRRKNRALLTAQVRPLAAATHDPPVETALQEEAPSSPPEDDETSNDDSDPDWLEPRSLAPPAPVSPPPPAPLTPPAPPAPPAETLTPHDISDALKMLQLEPPQPSKGGDGGGKGGYGGGKGGAGGNVGSRYGDERRFCCSARRHVVFNRARSKLAARAGKPPPPHVHLHGCASLEACSCCCRAVLSRAVPPAVLLAELRELRCSLRALTAHPGASGLDRNELDTAAASVQKEKNSDKNTNKSTKSKRKHRRVCEKEEIKKPRETEDEEDKDARLARELEEWRRQKSAHAKYFQLSGIHQRNKKVVNTVKAKAKSDLIIKNISNALTAIIHEQNESSEAMKAKNASVNVNDTNAEKMEVQGTSAHSSNEIKDPDLPVADQNFRRTEAVNYLNNESDQTGNIAPNLPMSGNLQGTLPNPRESTSTHTVTSNVLGSAASNLSSVNVTSAEPPFATPITHSKGKLGPFHASNIAHPVRSPVAVKDKITVTPLNASSQNTSVPLSSQASFPNQIIIKRKILPILPGANTAPTVPNISQQGVIVGPKGGSPPVKVVPSTAANTPMYSSVASTKCVQIGNKFYLFPKNNFSNVTAPTAQISPNISKKVVLAFSPNGAGNGPMNSVNVAKNSGTSSEKNIMEGVSAIPANINDLTESNEQEDVKKESANAQDTASVKVENIFDESENSVIPDTSGRVADNVLATSSGQNIAKIHGDASIMSMDIINAPTGLQEHVKLENLSADTFTPLPVKLENNPDNVVSNALTDTSRSIASSSETINSVEHVIKTEKEVSDVPADHRQTDLTTGSKAQDATAAILKNIPDSSVSGTLPDTMSANTPHDSTVDTECLVKTEDNILDKSDLCLNKDIAVTAPVTETDAKTEGHVPPKIIRQYSRKTQRVTPTPPIKSMASQAASSNISVAPKMTPAVTLASPVIPSSATMMALTTSPLLAPPKTASPTITILPLPVPVSSSTVPIKAPPVTPSITIKPLPMIPPGSSSTTPVETPPVTPPLATPTASMSSSLTIKRVPVSSSTAPVVTPTATLSAPKATPVTPSITIKPLPIAPSASSSTTPVTPPLATSEPLPTITILPISINPQVASLKIISPPQAPTVKNLNQCLHDRKQITTPLLRSVVVSPLIYPELSKELAKPVPPRKYAEAKRKQTHMNDDLNVVSVDVINLDVSDSDDHDNENTWSEDKEGNNGMNSVTKNVTQDSNELFSVSPLRSDDQSIDVTGNDNQETDTQNPFTLAAGPTDDEYNLFVSPPQCESILEPDDRPSTLDISPAQKKAIATDKRSIDQQVCGMYTELPHKAFCKSSLKSLAKPVVQSGGQMLQNTVTSSTGKPEKLIIKKIVRVGQNSNLKELNNQKVKPFCAKEMKFKKPVVIRPVRPTPEKKKRVFKKIPAVHINQHLRNNRSPVVEFDNINKTFSDNTVIETPTVMDVDDEDMNDRNAKLSMPDLSDAVFTDAGDKSVTNDDKKSVPADAQSIEISDEDDEVQCVGSLPVITSVQSLRQPDPPAGVFIPTVTPLLTVPSILKPFDASEVSEKELDRISYIEVESLWSLARGDPFASAAAYVRDRDPTRVAVLCVDRAAPRLLTLLGTAYLLVTSRKLPFKDPAYYTMEPRRSSRRVLFSYTDEGSHSSNVDGLLAAVNNSSKIDSGGNKGNTSGDGGNTSGEGGKKGTESGEGGNKGMERGGTEGTESGDGGNKGMESGVGGTRLKVKAFAQMSARAEEGGPSELIADGKFYKKMLDDPIVYAQVWSVIADEASCCSLFREGARISFYCVERGTVDNGLVHTDTGRRLVRLLVAIMNKYKPQQPDEQRPTPAQSDTAVTAEQSGGEAQPTWNNLAPWVSALNDLSWDEYYWSKVLLSQKAKLHASTGLGSTGLGIMRQGNTGHGNMGHGNTGLGNMGHGSTGLGNMGQGNTGHGNMGQGSTGLGNMGQGNTGLGIMGQGNTGLGIMAQGNTGLGIMAQGNTGLGIMGQGNTGLGIMAQGNTGLGIMGQGNTGLGIMVQGNTGLGIMAQGNTGLGIMGQGNTGLGIMAQGNTGLGIMAQGNTGLGIMGQGNTGLGIMAQGNTGLGIMAQGNTGLGIMGQGNTGLGIMAQGNTGLGIMAQGNTGLGIMGPGNTGHESTEQDGPSFSAYYNNQFTEQSQQNSNLRTSPLAEPRDEAVVVNLDSDDSN